MAARGAAGPKLAAYVHVLDDKGVSRAFGPDDEVPSWAARKIVNPKAWEGGELPKLRAASKAQASAASAPEGDDVDEVEETDETEEPEAAGAAGQEPPAEGPESAEAGTPGEVGPEVPPRQGSGSGKAAWHTYAKAVGLDVAEETTRDEVIELLEDAGLLEDAQE